MVSPWSASVERRTAIFCPDPVAKATTAVCSSIDLSLQRGTCSLTWSEPMSAQLPTDTTGELIAQLFRSPLQEERRHASRSRERQEPSKPALFRPGSLTAALRPGPEACDP